jgi:hypothetical protein
MRKSEQVGLFLSQQKWDIVWLRAQEVTAATSVVLTRWSEEPSGNSRDNLLRCQRLSSSISGVALVSSSNPPTAQQVAQMSQTHGRVAQLLSAEPGEALRSEARRQALKVDESLDGVLEQLAKLDQS